MLAPQGIQRLAVISSPRAGNTWLRRLLAATYHLEERAFHTPTDVPWSTLPVRCALQLHWPREESLCTLLHAHGFRIVSIARHPLDLLLSILHFSPHEPATSFWLAGAGGTEAALLNATPCSTAFLDYATGPRSTALLEVTRDWWSDALICRVRYEELVSNTAGELERVCADLGAPMIAATIARALIAGTRETVQHVFPGAHVWQAQPGLWRKLLPAQEAQRIAAAHPQVFTDLGYSCVPAPTLDSAEADRNWAALR